MPIRLMPLASGPSLLSMPPGVERYGELLSGHDHLNVMRTETYDACEVRDATDEPVCSDCGELMTPIPPVGWIRCRCLSVRERP